MSEMDNDASQDTSRPVSQLGAGSGNPMEDPNLTTIRVTMATILAHQNEANRRLEKIENQLEDKFVKKTDIVSIINRLEALEANQRWVVRTVLTAVILGVGAAIMLLRFVFGVK